jgi:hypothetical protein
MIGRLPKGLGIAVLVGLLWVLSSARAALSEERRKTPERPAKQPAAEEPAEPDQDQAQQSPKHDAPETAKSPAKPALNAQQSALRNRVQRLLSWYARLPVNTADNTPGEILQFCLACGCDAEVRSGGASGSALNGFGALCYNYPCAGYEMLAASDGAVMARIGYGLQACPGEMIAAMALSGVPADYEIRLDHKENTVADLVEYEKKTCRPGTDLSLKLIGLSYYVADDASWKDQLGETWSVQRVLKEELSRSLALGDCDVTNHLTALTWAIQRRARAGRPLEGPYGQAETELAKFEDTAFRAQNRDGSWPASFLAYRASSRNGEGSLLASGHVLSWLAYRLPDDRLNDPRMVHAVTFVTGVLEQWSSQWNVTDTSPREISAVMHSLHALRVYDRRFFKPREPAKPDPDAEKVGKRNGGREVRG